MMCVIRMNSHIKFILKGFAIGAGLGLIGGLIADDIFHGVFVFGILGLAFAWNLTVLRMAQGSQYPEKFRTMMAERYQSKTSDDTPPSKSN